MYSGFSEPSALKRRSCRRICPKRAPFGTLLKRLGQSWLVSRFASSSGTAIPQSVANGAMALPRPAQRAHVGETPAQRSSSRHGRAHEMCAPERALPPLKVPVRGRCAALAGPQLVAVERGAERAAGGTPFEPGLGENAIKPFGLRLTLCEPGTTQAGTTARPPLATAAAARMSSIRLLVHDPMNTRSIAMSASGMPGVRPM